ncbi:MAG TPA: hypothetical protein VN608_01995 [Clostridia bacterium]|nr:hypothetical protein [Clostridia bacterium]
MSVASGVFFIISLVILAERLFFTDILGFPIPVYAAVLTALLGFLIATLQAYRIKRRLRSKNKLKKLRRARALMVLNILACVTASAIWLTTLIKLL